MATDTGIQHDCPVSGEGAELRGLYRLGGAYGDGLPEQLFFSLCGAECPWCGAAWIDGDQVIEPKRYKAEGNRVPWDDEPFNPKLTEV